MLDYETCKRLRDAGYPAWDDDKANTGAGVTQSNVFVTMTAVRTEPSLEELLDEIEKLAGDERIWTLQRRLSDIPCEAIYVAREQKWDTQTGHTRWHDVTDGKGSTPAEAAAELWIKLKEREANG